MGYDEVEEMARRGWLEERINKVRELCERLRKEMNISAVVVFGSTARGVVRKDSDVDVLVITNDKHKDWCKVARICRGVEDEYCIISIYYATVEELRRDPRIMLDMVDENIVIYDDGVFNELISKLKMKLKQWGARRVWIDDRHWYWELKPDWERGERIELSLD